MDARIENDGLFDIFNNGICAGLLSTLALGIRRERRIGLVSIT